MDDGLMMLLSLGGMCGLLIALLFRHRANALVRTIVFSLLVGTFAQIIVAFIVQAHDAYTKDGYSIGRSLRAGVGAAFILSFSAPFTCGLPGALVGYVCQRLFQKRDGRKLSE